MKRNYLKHILLCLCLFAGTTTVFAYAYIDGIYYSFSGNEATVTYKDYYYNSNSYSGTVTIPSSVTYNDITYSVTSIGSYAFRDCYGLTFVTIPESVTSIGELAFYGCSGLTSVTIPNSVTSIGNHAFYYCSGLTSITIGNSVTSIGAGAFYHCSRLTSITIPNSVTSIGESAFSDCGMTSIVVESGNTVYDSRNNCNAIIETATNSLIAGCMNTTIPNSVTSIGDYAFCECSGLTSVTISNSVTSIGECAFASCSSLTSVTIPNSVTSIGGYAFDGTAWYDNQPDGLVYAGKVAYKYKGTMPEGTEIVIKDGTLGIADYAFCECSGLTSVTIPNSVTSIGDYAFYGCSSLTSVTIGNSVTSIGECAFASCSSLTSVTIGNSVTNIGGGAFYYCSSLTSVTIPNSVTTIGSGAFAGTAWYDNQPDGLVYAGKVAYKYKGTMPEGTEIVIKDGTLGIADYAFSYCRGLTSVTIPNSVTSIGDGAFSVCSSLTSLTIGNSVTSIGDAAFCYCGNLTSVYSHITNPFKASSDMFANVNSEATLYVPVGTKALYEEAGWAAFFKEVVEMGAGDVFTASTTEGVTMTFKILSNDEKRCQVGNGEEASVSTATPGQVTVPEVANGFKVTAIGDKGFYNCSKLTHIWLHEGIEHIGKLAFYGCTSLQVLDIPHSVVEISDDAFEGCTNLQVNIPSEIIATLSYVPSPGSGVVIAITPPAEDSSEQLHELERIFISRAVTSIDERSFSGCKSVKVIEVDAENPVFDSRDNCNAIIRTADNTLLFGCQNTVIPKTVTAIAPYAFEGHSNLKTIIIPNGVTRIAGSAFLGCSSLSNVTIGSGVTAVGNMAFADCTSLTDVYCYAENVPSTGIDAFSGSPISSATLYVPAISLESYETTLPWSGFGNIVPMGEVVRKCSLPTVSYANGKLAFKCETEDVNFIYNIKDDDIRYGAGSEVNLTATYVITVFATRAGYEDSDVATATLCWIDVEPQSEGLEEDAIAEVKAMPALVQSVGGQVIVSGIDNGIEVAVYSVNGMKEGSAISVNGQANIPTGMTPGTVAVVKIGSKSVKIVVK